MLLVAVAALQTLALDQVSEPLNQTLNEIFAFIPRVVGAALLLVAAIVAARILRALVARALLLARVDRRLGEQVGEQTDVSVSGALSEASFWLTLLLFLPAILGVLAIEGLTEPVRNMVEGVLVSCPTWWQPGSSWVWVGWSRASPTHPYQPHPFLRRGPRWRARRPHR